MTVFFIAEAGVNHNGDADRALAMVDAAHFAGADAIKFQTFTAEKLVSPLAKKADYQARETGEGNQFDMLKGLEISPHLHHLLVERCSALGIEFMSTPFDEDAAQFLVGLGMRHLKVPSGEIDNHPFLRFLSQFDLPMILSTGMANMDEITEAVAVIVASRAHHGFMGPLSERLTILHCTSNYPAACADINLRAMATIGAHTSLPIGYSDHSLGLAVSTAAVALGAQVIEKHFTLDRSLPGPDHKASLEVGELTALIRQIRDVEAALGSPIKAPTESELPVRAIARRSVCVRRDLPAGHMLAETDLILLRPASGIAPKHFADLAGRCLSQPITAGTPIIWQDIV
jgi:N,N'-diacetyllegionaminate synthase